MLRISLRRISLSRSGGVGHPHARHGDEPLLELEAVLERPVNRTGGRDPLKAFQLVIAQVIG